MDSTLIRPQTLDPARLASALRHARNDGLALARPLEAADWVCSGPDGRPPGWHLGHTTWFLEAFLLRPFADAIAVGHPLYEALFSAPPGAPLSRPGREELIAYRERVDEAVLALLEGGEADRQPQILSLLALALEHEHRHQEQFLEDVLELYAASPFRPAYREAPEIPACAEAPALGWTEHPGGEVQVGADDDGFALADERPRHRRWLAPFALATRLITNGEYLAFMEDGGYRRPELWQEAGWRARRAGDWQAPARWQRLGDAWWQMTLYGLRPLDPQAPVSHLSHYEAEAYARWAQARLPDEHEWEAVAATQPLQGHLRGDGLFLPQAATGTAPAQFFGDLWEWTRSPYAPYPGHRPPAAPMGEYDGRFPCGHLVLRGGSCLTPAARLRPTLREHAPAAARTRFTGLRLARDLD